MRVITGRHITWERVAIVLVLLLAAGLRLHGIARESLWFDEAATVHIVRQPLPRMMELIRADERIPPLHYFLLHGWIKVFGISETSVRMPSAIAGVAAVWFLFSLTARLANPTAAVIAALLLAISRYQIDYSHEGRAYTLMLLLALWSGDLFVELIQRRRPATEAAYVIVTAALLYAHLYGVFTLLAQHVAYAVDWWAHRSNSRAASEPAAPGTDDGSAPAHLPPRRWLLLNLAVVALFSPWIPTAVAWTRSVNKQFWVQPMTPMEIVHTFHIYAGSWAALGLLVALAVVGVARTRRRGRLALLLALATLPVVIPVIISSIGRPTFTNRYGIVAPAALDALAGIGVAATGIQFVQVACVAALCVLAPFARPEHGPKPQWRQAGAYLTTAMRPGDVAVVNRRAATYLYEYYVHRPDMRPRGFDGEAIPLSLPLRPGQHVWLIVHSDLVTPQQILGRAHWRVLSERHFHMIDIYELEEDRPAPSTSP